MSSPNQDMSSPNIDGATVEERQHAMSVFARAESAEMEKLYATLDHVPEWTFARSPETGLVMVRGRIGGGGAPFNVGEMSVTRAAVTLSSGELGHAYVAGRNQRKAAIAAVFDAMWQNRVLRRAIELDVIAPLAEKQEKRDEIDQRQAAATKVDFFTMARGDD